MKKANITLLLLIFSISVMAQIPNGYYNGTDGLEGSALKLKLRTIIDGHTSVGYDGLYNLYRTSDNYVHNGNNVVWDMYSMHNDGTANYWFTHVSDKCGTYGIEGDCYNREHTIPQSWGLNTTQKADAFFVIPTDGKVNGMRSSLPYGETSSSRNISTNGSKTGNCTYPGYSGTIFEPIDRFKGDLARGYFYAATRYNVNSLSGASFSGDGFSSWTKSMLLEWAANDPVSQKEIDRNNAIYAAQHNRNPYIDHPEWVECVFGNNCSTVGFTSTPVTSAMATQTYTYSITYNVDVDTETITGTTIPSWLTFTKDEANNTALLTGTPSASDVGTHNVVLTLTEAGETDTQNFTITVSPYGAATVTLFDKDFDDNSLTSGGWTSQSIVGGSQEWIVTTHTGYSNGNYAKMSGFDGTNNNANEDWLISPAVNCNDYTDETLTFVTAMKSYGNDGVFNVYILEDYNGTDDPNNTTLNEITSQATLSSGDYNFTASGNIDISAYTGTIYVAFKYSCGTASGKTWEVENIKMTGKTMVAVDILNSEIKLYPNPTNNTLFIEMDSNIDEINILNILGQHLISKNNINKNRTKLNVNSLSSGIYIITITDTNGNTVKSKFLKK